MKVARKIIRRVMSRRGREKMRKRKVGKSPKLHLLFKDLSPYKIQSLYQIALVLFHLTITHGQYIDIVDDKLKSNKTQQPLKSCSSY
jgi:hypothetical protein